jgi:hemerythrin
MKIYAVCFYQEWECINYMSYHFTKEEAELKRLEYFKKYVKRNCDFYIEEIEINSELMFLNEN